jgi:hypothetical protein
MTDAKNAYAGVPVTSDPIVAANTNAEKITAPIRIAALVKNPGKFGCTISVIRPGASNRSTKPGCRSVGVSYESVFAMRVPRF